jgi:putative PIN family toxin of toxin-antitoxin system
VRAILDPNVIISGLLSRGGTPANVLRAWLGGRFDLVVSPLLMAELRRALAYPKLAERIRADEAASLLDWLSRETVVIDDPEEESDLRSEDPGDDYLLALAEQERATLVSGDRHLLALSSELPVLTPREILDIIGGS